MPEGVVQWFDPATGEGRVLHAGRRYAMRADSTEPAARVAGARVRFDIDHDADGDVATAVELRPGTRVSRRQRRFGDLTSTARPDAKGTAPFASNQPELGHDLQRHPMEVARQWSRLLAAGDLEEVMMHYAPDAALHVGGEVLTGPAAIRGHWERSPLLGGPAPAAVGGDDGTVLVRWADIEPDSTSTGSRLRIHHGEIAEQWLGSVSAPTVEPTPSDVELSAAGEITDTERAYALDKIGKVLATVGEPVLHTSVRLDLARDPARERPAQARVTLDLNGEPVRAHVAAGTVSEAVDLLEGRLRHRLEHIAQHREQLRRRPPASPPGEWRHGDLPEQRPPYFPLPVEERQIVRHKTFSSPRATVDEAIFDLEAMDLDFFLFTDLASGRDALVQRRPGGTYQLQYLDEPDEHEAPTTAAALEIVDHAAPELTQSQARELLDLGGEPHVFFADRTSGRGRVLYRRYDGHYGLITPMSE